MINFVVKGTTKDDDDTDNIKYKIKLCLFNYLNIIIYQTYVLLR
jgi:hypothetical protein